MNGPWGAQYAQTLEDWKDTWHNKIQPCLYSRIHSVITVTLVVEVQDQGFTSHKLISLLEFGTNIYMIFHWLSQWQNKNPIFPTFWTNLIFDILVFILVTQLWLWGQFLLRSSQGQLWQLSVLKLHIHYREELLIKITFCK